MASSFTVAHKSEHIHERKPAVISRCSLSYSLLLPTLTKYAFGNYLIRVLSHWLIPLKTSPWSHKNLRICVYTGRCLMEGQDRHSKIFPQALLHVIECVKKLPPPIVSISAMSRTTSTTWQKHGESRGNKFTPI